MGPATMNGSVFSAGPTERATGAWRRPFCHSRIRSAQSSNFRCIRISSWSVIVVISIFVTPLLVALVAAASSDLHLHRRFAHLGASTNQSGDRATNHVELRL